MKKLILLVFAALFLITIVSAAAPLFSSGDTGFQVESPVRTTIPFNESHKFHFHLFNKSTGLPVETSEATCNFDLYDNMGNHQFKGQAEFDAPYDFEIELSAFNFTRLGKYNYVMQCNDSNYGGFVGAEFEVTPTGESITEPHILGGLGLILSIILMAGLFTFFGFQFFDSDKTFPLGLFFVVMALTLSVYTLHLGYIFSRDILYLMDMEGSQYKMYIGVMWGLMAMAFIALWSLMIKTVKEIKVRKSYNQVDDGWQEDAYKPGFRK